MVKPTGASSYETLSPEIFIGSLPSALVAETLGGLTKDQFLKPDTGNLNQTNLQDLFSSTNYPKLTGLLTGTTLSTGGANPSNYVITANSGNSSTGEIRFATGATVKALITNAGDFIANHKIGIGTGATAPTTDMAFGGNTDRMIGVERNTTGAEGKNSSSKPVELPVLLRIFMEETSTFLLEQLRERVVLKLSSKPFRLARVVQPITIRRRRWC
jgi:hypothetical protein